MSARVVSRAWRLAIAVAGAASLVATASTAAAQPAGPPGPGQPPADGAPPIDEATRGSARELGEQGNALFAAGDYAGALDKFERANALVPVPTLGVRIARSLVALGRLVEASERYLAVSRAGLPPSPLPVHERALEEARAEREALLPRIPSLVVTVSPPEAAILIDGAPLPSALVGEKRVVDPGRHVIEARLGATTRRVEVEVAEGATVPVHLTIDGAPTGPASAAPPPPSGHGDGSTSPWPIVGWTAVGVGGASTVIGLVTGLVAMGQRDDLEARCGEALACPPSAHDDASSYNGMRTASAITLFAGLGIAAAGATILVLDPGGDDASPEGAAARVIAGPGRVGIVGRF